MMDDVRIVTSPPRQLAVTVSQGTAADIGPLVSSAFGTVIEHLARMGRRPDGPAVARYTMRDDGSFDLAAGFPVDEAIAGDGVVEPLTLPAVEVATTTFLGAYRDLPLAYDRLRTGVAELGRQLDEVGPMWEEYWSEPTAQPEETRTVIFWPLLPA
jgi:effector-binding domain-containing protein